MTFHKLALEVIMIDGDSPNVDFLRAALNYAARGWPVFPLHGIRDGRCTCGGDCGVNAGKHPRTAHGVKDATADAERLRAWWGKSPDSNIGVATGAAGGFVVLDIDPRASGDEVLWELERKHGELPATVISLTGGGGSHLLFEYAAGLKNSAGEIGPGLDFKTDGGYIVAPPSLHASGRRYRWEGASRPDEAVIAPAPPWLLELARGAHSGNGNGSRPGGAAAIPELIPDGTKHRTCVSLAGSMRRRGCNSAEIFAALLKLAERFETPVPPENLRRIAESVEGLYEPPKLPEAAPAIDSEGRAPRFSEEALAARLTQRHADNLRYVAVWGRWLQFDGARWAQDDTLHVFDRAREICRAASVQGAGSPQVAVRVASAATVAAIERLARADRRHAATVGQWDADPWSLNTPDGMIDLRTGHMEPHRRDAYCTKMTAVAPGGPCPLWDTFLDQVTDGDREIQAFLCRMVGYCLTADTREHALFFLYGTGANGKSVFLNTVAGILSDYAKVAAIETFISSPAEHHPTDLAGLQGARLVTATETEDGRRWAESKIKALTGGDKIAARFMRQDFFEFTPVFKLVIAGNHKPGLRSVDEAIRRRLHLVPFTVTIPPEERDRSLSQKLRAEWGGVLAWAIAGCLQWQQRGLDPPASVRDATEAYMASEDGFAQWLDAHCDQLANAVETSERLFADWKGWAESAGEHVGSQKRLSQNLEERGFAKTRTTKGARGFRGIGLRGATAGGGA